VTAYTVGQGAAWAGLQDLSKSDLESAEVTGFPIVALILLAVFGSFAAAALPLGLGLTSVLVTGALIYLISRQMEMSVFVTNMASMIGIGVAVDYSLFIVARFREEVREGRSAAEARAEALSTSGLAVAFSGIAVIVSLAGLWMIDNGALRSMALGAMLVVAVSILAATTLLTALIRILGYRVEAGGAPWTVIGFIRKALRRRRRPGSTRPDRALFWERWTERVMARPWRSVAAVSAVMLTLAVPVLSMETDTGALDQFPADHDVRVGADLATGAAGGSSDPVQVVAAFGQGGLDEPANRGAVDRFSSSLRADPGVRTVAAPVSGPGSALIQVTPSGRSESERVTALVERVRDDLAPSSALSRRASIDVGGAAARVADVSDQISGSMWRILAFILALSFVVLMLMLRSILLPLKAILMNLLSIGAAYGVLVAIFQWGWLDGFLGFRSLGHIDVLNPPLILAIVFGLSMDYEVFLLSRIRERYLVHGDNRRAVAEGLASSARTISSAALIMTTVFAVFVLTGVPSIKEIGVGCAVAIALDATLVRLILVPAAMQLMGRWNWWLPGWLDRLLPDLSFERGRRAPEPARA
jgi:RND superfamily putative drug exporter